MIRVVCQCGAKLKVKDELAGRVGKCPTCGEKLTIPKPTPAAPAPANDFAPIPFDSLEDELPPTPIILPENRDGLGTVAPDPSERQAQPASVGDDDDEQRRLFIKESVPPHLGQLNYYLICDHKDVVARWVNDGKGWMIRLKDGFTRASTVSGEIPQFGKFIMVEVGVERRNDGLHLSNITPFQLQPSYALTKLTKGDDEILAAVLAHAELNTAQTGHVRNLVKQKFLPHIWPEMDALLP